MCDSQLSVPTPYGYTDVHDVIVNRLGHHIHGSDAGRVEVVKIKANTKRRTLDKVELPSQIRNQAVRFTSQSVQVQTPSISAIKKLSQRARAQNEAPLSTPTDLASLVVPDQYKFYHPSPDFDKLFLLEDSGQADPNRVTIFGRDYHRNWVQDMDRVFIDGTFTLAPPLFSQVFVILAKRAEYLFPVMYALLPNKSQETYDGLFGLIKTIWPLFNSTSISLGFEMAVMNSVRQAFQRAEIHGCLFRLTKSMRRQLSENGLLQRYNAKPRFVLHASMTVALAVVPIDNLDDAFDALSNQLANDLTSILNRLEDNHIGRPGRNTRRNRPAPFPPEIWSMYQRTISGIDKTNNHAEAAHRRLKRELDVVHLSIWKFIDGLHRVHKGRDVTHEQYVRGELGPVKRREYKQVDQRLLTTVNDYNNRDIIEYLRGIAHNFLMECTANFLLQNVSTI